MLLSHDDCIADRLAVGDRSAAGHPCATPLGPAACRATMDLQVAQDSAETAVPAADLDVLRQGLAPWWNVADDPSVFPHAVCALPSGHWATCRHHFAADGRFPQLDIRWQSVRTASSLPFDALDVPLAERRSHLPSVCAALDLALKAPPVAVLISPDQANSWLATLLQLLPRHARQEFSFSGWEFAPPLPGAHLLLFVSDARMAKCCEANGFLDVREGIDFLPPPTNPWVRGLQLAINAGGWPALVQKLQELPPTTRWSELAAMDARSARLVEPSRLSMAYEVALVEAEPACHAQVERPLHTVAPLAPSGSHGRIELNLSSESILEQLDRLDAAAFAAVRGDAAALADFEALWPAAERDLDPAWIAESRSHYVRRCLDELQHSLDPEAFHTDQAAVRLRMLRLLTTKGLSRD